MTNPAPIRIGVLGAAALVPNALTELVRGVPEAKVPAIPARDSKRAEAFARERQIPRGHQTYNNLPADPKIDAVYEKAGLKKKGT
jgi:predicted dehydrogenase